MSAALKAHKIVLDEPELPEEVRRMLQERLEEEGPLMSTEEVLRQAERWARSEPDDLDDDERLELDRELDQALEEAASGAPMVSNEDAFREFDRVLREARTSR